LKALWKGRPFQSRLKASAQNRWKGAGACVQGTHPGESGSSVKYAPAVRTPASRFEDLTAKHFDETLKTNQLRKQLGGWAEAGFLAVKMKIGRVHVPREAIGTKVQLFVDTGAYTRKQALYQAHWFMEDDVTSFEEPVSADDLDGLRMIRDEGPSGMNIAAGEYGYDSWYFRRMLSAGAVEVLQADATRCAGVTGFLVADALCESWCMPLSAHTSPSIHAHACCGAQRVINVEYFYDHARIERMAFDGVLKVTDGLPSRDLSRPGFGLTLKEADMRQYIVYDTASESARETARKKNR
jgi:L-alanine-DL-glutamate epimerase-like enolase superfamily enzyme